MPTISSRTKIKAATDLYAVTLNVRHCLVAGNPSVTTYHTTTRFPENVDVLASNLPISISGSFDGCKASSMDIVASSLAEHLASYFRKNAEELRLSMVSDVFLDKDSEQAKILLSFSRQYPPVKSEIRPHALLVALELDFSWKTTASSHSASNTEDHLTIASHPFSSKLSLPFRGLLDNVIKRFITWQCVKRYPLIFGSWCQQLDLEASYFPTIFTSILSIVERSSNESFRDSCHRLFKMLRHRHMTAFSEASSSLRLLAGSSQDDELAENERPVFTNEEALHFAMERVYRDGLRQPLPKGLMRGPIVDKADDEELSQDHLFLPATRFDEQLFLDDPPVNDVPSPLIRSLTDLPSDQLFMEMELDHADDFLLHSGDPGTFASSDCEQVDECHMLKAEVPLLQIPIDFPEQRDCDITSAVIDFSDSDSAEDLSYSYRLQTHGNLDIGSESVPHYVAPGHATEHADKSSHDNSKQIGYGSKDTKSPTSSHSPPVSVFYQDSSSGTSQEAEALSPAPQLTSWQLYTREDISLVPDRVTKCTNQLQESYGLLDDPDILLLSDPESPYFNGVDVGCEDYYEVEEFEGEYPDLDPSQHSPTLLTTCSHRDCDLNVEEKCEHGEPRFNVNVDSLLDEARTQPSGDEWGEDGMVVIDF